MLKRFCIFLISRVSPVAVYSIEVDTRCHLKHGVNLSFDAMISLKLTRNIFIGVFIVL